MAKRIFAVVMIVTIALLCVPMMAYASEAGAQTEESVDILYRVKDFFVKNEERIIEISGVIAGILASIYSIYKGVKAIINVLGTKADDVSMSQNNVVNATNTMIDNYNQMKEQYERMNALLENFFVTASNIERQSKTVLDIIETVYVNSKNLPQGVKDLVTDLYARCVIADHGNADAIANIENSLLLPEGCDGK